MVTSSLSTDQLNEAYFDTHSTRDFFLRQLDIVRGGQNEMSTDGFDVLKDIMIHFLSACDKSNDIAGALRAANMANTFYHTLSGIPGAHDKSLGENKKYIMHVSEFRGHSIWKSPGFWEHALNETVYQQLALQEALKWDDLGQSVLIENVLNTHTLIFGQLASLAFTMHELGLEFEEVVSKVEKLAKVFELSEDQRIELYGNVESNFQEGRNCDR